MGERHLPELEGERVRHNDDTWELTGAIDIKQNGARIHAEATKSDRVRGNRGTLGFTLADPPASLNPGTSESLDGELQQTDDGYELVIGRRHTTSRYELNNVSY